MHIPGTFLWGGATSDFQYEGGFGEDGRGLLTRDYETDGNVTTPRQLTPRCPMAVAPRSTAAFSSASPSPRSCALPLRRPVLSQPSGRRFLPSLARGHRAHG
ncbi:MAG: family 1 glycosylhydrolase [Collinsella sp.]